MTGAWRELLDASRRRLSMLQDDLTDLVDALEQAKPEPDVPLDVQRPFDSLLLRYVAAVEQATDALLLACGLTPDPGLRDAHVREAVLRLSPEFRKDITTWFAQPIRADAKDIRNLSTHSSYQKRLVGDEWRVQQPRHGRPVEPRDMQTYAIAVAKHARRLTDLMPRLETELSRIDPDLEE